MKFCLNSRLSSQYLQTADQIKVAYRDIDSIPDISAKFPQAEIIVCMSNNPTENDMRLVRQYQKIHPKDLILAFSFFPPAEMREGFRFYATYPVESFSEANALIAQGVDYIRLGSPLAFMIDKVAELKIPVRLVPNQPYLSIVPRENGVCGQWIRPEDLPLYDERLTDAVVEFDFCRLTEEEALYRIYSDEQRWPGPLNYIVQNLNDNALNRLLEPGIGLARLNCGHKCQDPTGSCHVCHNAFRLANMLEAKHRVDKN